MEEERGDKGSKTDGGEQLKGKRFLSMEVAVCYTLYMTTPAHCLPAPFPACQPALALIAWYAFVSELRGAAHERSTAGEVFDLPALPL